MKKLLTIITLLFWVNLATSQSISFPKISRAVKKITKDNSSHEVRMELFKITNIDFNQVSDTLFFLETSKFETSGRYGLIWNSKEGIEYYYLRGSFNFLSKSYAFGFLTKNNTFIPYMIELVNNWDIENIQLEEKLHSNFTPNDLVHATRIIIKNGKLNIEHICFKDFFYLERDRRD
ncbi:MAG: hypothetical protein EAZ55_14830 [Cytophagales bacterium]|nr:MAG: hypothetical protein EAZ55_14830 [Cytophagales bacterium]